MIGMYVITFLNLLSWGRTGNEHVTKKGANDFFFFFFKID